MNKNEYGGNVMDIKNLILTGLVTSYVFVLSAFTLFYHNPRYMLRMLPKEFAPHLETTTKDERNTYFKFMGSTAIFLILFTSGSMYLGYKDKNISFLTFFIEGYLIMMMINIADFIIMDMILFSICANNFAKKLDMNVKDFRPFKLWKKHLFIEHILENIFLLCPIVGIITGSLTWLLRLIK
jgi:hypothetical protein